MKVREVNIYILSFIDWYRQVKNFFSGIRINWGSGELVYALHVFELLRMSIHLNTSNSELIN